MKYTKILRIFSIAFILSLLVTALPATPALAVGTITLTPAEGSIGDWITITGSSFTKSNGTEYYVDIYFSSDEASTVHYIASTTVNTYKKVKDGQYIDTEGEFSTTFLVPTKLEDGSDDEDVQVGNTYWVYATSVYNVPPGATKINAVAQFTVTGGEITRTPTSGTVGTEVEITGTNFSKSTSITIEYDSAEITIASGDTATDSNGAFASVIAVPESTTGAHTITVTVSGSEVEASFTVKPEMTLDKTSGEAGTTVTVSGTGFGNMKQIGVYFNTSLVASTATRSKGSFSTTFTVPELEAGLYNLEVEDEGGSLKKVGFTVTVPSSASTPSPTPTPSATTVSISPIGGHIGTELLISGTGFEAAGKITVKYDNDAVATATADSNGAFVATFKVPASKYGTHTITASDDTKTQQLTFTMESTPPSVPSPLLPAMGAQVKAPIIIDWEDVTDDSSPVTYTLQVATIKDFAAASIVLEKKGITESTYIVTDEERLKLVSRETPYYWRVRAIDGASNEGDWTGAGEFLVAATFNMPSWALYTLMGLSGLFLFALGYWLGRRTAYYY